MLGIIGAMPQEVEQLKNEMDHAEVTSAAKMDFYKGKICGKDVVVVRSGVGKVNAAICVQILADRFGVDGIVNTGVAGSLRAEINIGDLVLSTDAVQHDVDGNGIFLSVGPDSSDGGIFFCCGRRTAEDGKGVLCTGKSGYCSI